MSKHHFVSKSFIKYWQPSFDEELANENKSNGGVYVYDIKAGMLIKQNNLTHVFSIKNLNQPDVETKISTFIEKHLGNIDAIKTQNEYLEKDLDWKIFRALILLPLLQPSRLPGEGSKPFINEVFKKTEEELDQLASALKENSLVYGITLPKHVYMFLSEIGFFVFPLFDFGIREKVLAAKKTSDLWGVAVPIRPNFCVALMSKELVDIEWIKKNMHIFQTFSVGLKCSQLIVPPKLKDGGEMWSAGKTQKISLREGILDFRKTFKAADDLVKGWNELDQIEKIFQSLPTWKA